MAEKSDGLNYVMDMTLLDMDLSEEEGRAELDSHADTCCGGSNTVLLEETGRNVTVRSFTPEHDSLDGIPIGTVAGSYDSRTGETLLLVWNECMFFGDRLPTSLINPNQVRAAGHVVDECPKQFDKGSRHGIVTSCGLEINLEMNGVISFIPMRKPTDKEISECTRVEMTS